MMEWRTPPADVTCDIPAPVSDNRYSAPVLPGFLLVRFLLWLLVFAAFPLSVTAARVSFKTKVLRRTIPGALPAERSMLLAERVLLRLEQAERKESDPWLQDDLRIAWITVLEASRGNSQPHVDATYHVLGIHPDKVWQAILERRAALLGRNEKPLEGAGSFSSESSRTQVRRQSADTGLAPPISPKKPCASERNPRWRKAT